MRLPVIACIAATLVVAKPAHAYRPFDGTDADVAALHEVELEIGPLGYLRASHTSALAFPTVVANFGFLPRWELVLQGQGVFPQNSSARFTDGGAFVKHVLREGSLQEGHSGISIATEIGVLLPDNFSGDGGVYLGIILSHAWRPLTLHLNLQLARTQDGAGDFFAGLIVEGVPHARVRPVAELYIDSHGGVSTPSVLVGFIARCSTHLSLDAATRIAWHADAPLFEARAGFTYAFSL
jgi:hypothetical protein